MGIVWILWAKSPCWAQTGAAVEAWLTSHAQQTLAQQPTLHFSSGTGHGRVKIAVSDAITYQTIDGFGAALTDASAWLLYTQMSAAQRREVLESLFSTSVGIGISVVRLPIGASDFSLKPYTYNDAPKGKSDPQLQRFSIQRDQQYLLPLLKEIRQIQPRLKIVASPWSAPAWMKKPRRLNGGKLQSRYFATYAQYLLKYIQAYQAEGFPIDVLTLQNEPNYQTRDYPSMSMSAEDQAKLAQHLGKLLRQYQLNTAIFAWDHNWDQADKALKILGNAKANPYIQGTAWHAYAGQPTAQSRVHAHFPDKKIYFTEITGTNAHTDFSHNLTWSLHYIFIGTMRNWGNATLYWNIILNNRNGPHIAPKTSRPEEQLRGLVQWHEKRHTLAYQAEYYAMGHMSRWVQPGARRIYSNTLVKNRIKHNREPPTGGGNVESVAFINPDGSKVLVVLNPSWRYTRRFEVVWHNQHLSYTLGKESVVTLAWR